MKYIWRPHDGSEQLFNLEDDPREENNLAADERHHAALAQWRARLVTRLDGRPEGFSDGKKLVAGKEYRRIQATPKPKPRL
jgi:hypothetical protein